MADIPNTGAPAPKPADAPKPVPAADPAKATTDARAASQAAIDAQAKADAAGKTPEQRDADAAKAQADDAQAQAAHADAEAAAAAAPVVATTALDAKADSAVTEPDRAIGDHHAQRFSNTPENPPLVPGLDPDAEGKVKLTMETSDSLAAGNGPMVAYVHSEMVGDYLRAGWSKA